MQLEGAHDECVGAERGGSVICSTHLYKTVSRYNKSALNYTCACLQPRVLYITDPLPAVLEDNRPCSHYVGPRYSDMHLALQFLFRSMGAESQGEAEFMPVVFD